MAKNYFIREMDNVNDTGDIYALAYGYLVGFLEVECKRTNNGQISKALVEAKLAFLTDAIQLGYDALNPGRGA